MSYSRNILFTQTQFVPNIKLILFLDASRLQLPEAIQDMCNLIRMDELRNALQMETRLHTIYYLY